MAHTEITLTAHDKLPLRVQSWNPIGPARALVVITHGHGEHSGRYVHVGQALCQAGYAVTAYDLRGHGRSGGPRGHTPNYQALYDDLQLVFETARQSHPGLKPFLYGHSMGGQITLAFTLNRRPQVSGVIVSAPWLLLTYMPPRWKVRLGLALGRLMPTFTLKTGLDVAIPMSHDEIHLKAMPDPERSHSSISAGMGSAVLAMAADTYARAAECTWPLLIMHGVADAAMNPAGSKAFYERASSSDKTLRLYPGMYHEVHNETERGQVLNDVVAWLNART